VEFSEDTEHKPIRDAIREICRRFPDEYWAEADATQRNRAEQQDQRGLARHQATTSPQCG